MPGGTLGYGLELLLLSQGQSRAETIVLYAISQMKADARMGKDFPWPWVLLRHLCMMEAAHTQLSVAASSPCSFVPWPWCLLLLGLWQDTLWSGSPGTPREGSRQGTEPTTCLCC